MIIQSNSPLNRLPQNLDPKQGVVLDSIRTSLLFIEDSSNSLITLINQFSYNERRPKSHRIFSLMWSVIDHSRRLQKLLELLKTVIDVEFDSESYNVLRKAERMRHTLQHVDERIDEVFLKEQFPVFGQLSWVTQEQNENGKIWTIVAGCQSYDEPSMTPVNPAGKNLNNKIGLIQFSTMIKSSGQFSQQDIFLEDLLLSIVKLKEQLEDILQKNIDNLKDYQPQSSEFTLEMTFEYISESKIIVTDSLFTQEKID